MKLQSISFNNYKAFKKEQTIKIKPITVLIGKNSSGKSSIAKLFTLLKNSLAGEMEEPLLLENDGVSLGGEFRDLVYNRLPGSPIDFSLTFSDNTKLKTSIVQNRDEYQLTIYDWGLETDNLNLNFRYESLVDRYVDKNSSAVYECKFNGFIPQQIIDTDGKNILDGLNLDMSIDVDYIGPFRIVPERQVLSTGQIHFPTTGVMGENAYSMLGVSKHLKTDLLGDVGDWYENFFNGWRLDVGNRSRPFVEFNLVKDGTEVNIADVGQGMSQALPLIVRSHIGRKNSIIILEQPELHLHPAAHGDLAELFAKSAKLSEQNFIIETHAENIILRLRKLIIDNNFGLTSDDVIIYFVNESADGGQELMEILIEPDGVLTNWPEGVFNENLDEVAEIRRALTRKNKNVAK